VDCPWKPGDILPATAPQRLSRRPQLPASGGCSADKHDMLRILRIFHLWNAIWFLILYIWWPWQNVHQLFFGVMFLSTMFTKKLQDPRSLWHSQWWLLKSVLLMVGALVISTLAPAYWIQLYGLFPCQLAILQCN
jgi:hypothetical protein